mmetsp:Transcript_7792/g.11511  ORF Transcript_7792/g.11511 Transcript_7792/m.11511 type:complete len:90 (-) Transcript_7792:988-1257(-)
MSFILLKQNKKDEMTQVVSNQFANLSENFYLTLTIVFGKPAFLDVFSTVTGSPSYINSIFLDHFKTRKLCTGPLLQKCLLAVHYKLSCL